MTPHEALPPMIPVPEAERLNVIVIGAGVVGLSSALWLQRAGHQVRVIDRGPPLPGQPYTHACSFGNACTVALGACLPVAMPGVIAGVPKMLIDRKSPLALFWRDLPKLMPWLMSFLRSSTPSEVDRIVRVLGQLLRLAEAGNAPLMEEAGSIRLLRRNGSLYLYKSEQSFQAATNDMSLREREGVRMEVLDASAIREREPNLAPVYQRGLVFSDAYHIDTSYQYMLDLAQLFLARGGEFIRGEASSISRQNDDVSVQVDGTHHKADRLVVAGGAWSKRLAATVGDSIRLDTERGYHVLFPDAGHLLSAPTCYPEHGFYMTPLSEGLRVAGTVELGGLGQPTRPVRTNTISEVAKMLLPGLSRHDREWLGFRPSMPDSLPVIGPSPRDRRIIYAFGHGHIGLTLGGVTGYIVSDLISNRTPPIELGPLRPNRF
jgi:glycine/D-amino acid oxidase-like deaminating enzyme